VVLAAEATALSAPPASATEITEITQVGTSTTVVNFIDVLLTD
jgi:hypothetical protein